MSFEIKSRDLAQAPAIQSVWYDVDLAILVAGAEGRGVVSGCAVTAQGSPDMTVAVAAGVIRTADGVQVAVTGGNLTIDAANGSNPRVDLISVAANGTKTYTAGTAAASPKPPALTAGHVALAFVLVGTSDTAIQTAEISDKRMIVPPPAILGSNRFATTTTYSTTSTTLADVDATNMAVTFIAPPSGNVIVRLCAYTDIAAASAFVLWSLREGSSNIAGAGGTVLRDPCGGAVVTIDIPLSGLSAGSHTFKWSFAVTAGGTGRILAGAGGVAQPPAVMEVLAA